MNEESPKVLWHYTNLNGMMGILGTQTLRASDISLLNDGEEYSLGIDFIKSYLSSNFLHDYFPEQEGSEKYKKYIEEIIWQLDRMLYPRDLAYGKYVVSLSGARDQLSQWRGYGNNGYAIGFKYKELKRDVENIPELNNRAKGDIFELNKVYYVGSSSDLRNVKKFNKLFDSIARMMREEKDADIFTHNQDLYHYLPIYSPYVKHEGFEEEDEYRILVGSNRPPAGYSPTKFGPRAYVDVGFSRKSIYKVAIAPGDNRDVRLFAAQRFLQGNGYTDALGMVDYSQLSFRG